MPIMRNTFQRKCSITALILLSSKTPCLSAGLLGDIKNSQDLLMIIGGVGAVVMTLAIIIAFKRGGKSKEVLAYEAELERFRRSIRS